MSDDVDVKAIARGTPGFNGAGEYLKSITTFCHLVMKIQCDSPRFLQSHQNNFQILQTWLILLP